MRSPFSAAGFRLALRSSLETTVLQRSGYLLETLGLRALSRAVAKALSDRRLQATHRLPVFRSAVDQPAGPSSASSASSSFAAPTRRVTPTPRQRCAQPLSTPLRPPHSVHATSVSCV